LSLGGKVAPELGCQCRPHTYLGGVADGESSWTLLQAPARSRLREVSAQDWPVLFWWPSSWSLVEAFMEIETILEGEPLSVGPTSWPSLTIRKIVAPATPGAPITPTATPSAVLSSGMTAWRSEASSVLGPRRRTKNSPEAH